jgi:hypothetical protein
MEVVRRYAPRGVAASRGHLLLTSRLSPSGLARAGLTSTRLTVESLDVMGVEDSLTVLASVREGVRLPPAHAVAALGSPGSEDAVAAAWLAGPHGVDGLVLALHQAGAYMRERSVTCSQYVALFKSRQLDLFGDRGTTGGGQPLGPWLARTGLDRWAAQVVATAGVATVEELQALPGSALGDLGLPVLALRRLQRALAGVAASPLAATSRARRSVRTTWLLTMEQLAGEAGVGPAAVQAMQLVSLAGPDAVPVQLVAQAARYLPVHAPLRKFLVRPRGGATDAAADAGAIGTTDRGDASAAVLASSPHAALSTSGGVEGQGTGAASHAAQDVLDEEAWAASDGVTDTSWSAVPRSVQGLCGDLLASLTRYNLVSMDPVPSTPGVPPCFSLHRLLQSVLGEGRQQVHLREDADAVNCGLYAGMQAAWAARTQSWAGAVAGVEVWCAQALHMCHPDSAMHAVCVGPRLLSRTLVSVLLSCSGTLCLGGNPGAALPLAQAALSLLHHPLVGPRDAQLADALLRLGDAHYQLDHIPEALQLLSRGLELQRGVAADGAVAEDGGSSGGHGDRSSTTIRALSCMAIALRRVGDLPGSMDLAQQALEGARVRAGGSDSQDLAAMTMNVSNAHKEAGDLPTALSLCEAALAMFHRLDAVSGRDTGDVAKCMTSLGMLRAAAGDGPGAVQVLTGALGLMRRLWQGRDSRDVLGALTSLSHLREPEDAVPLQEEALGIAQRLYPTGPHSDVIAALANLAR